MSEIRLQLQKLLVSATNSQHWVERAYSKVLASFETEKTQTAMYMAAKTGLERTLSKEQESVNEWKKNINLAKKQAPELVIKGENWKRYSVQRAEEANLRLESVTETAEMRRSNFFEAGKMVSRIKNLQEAVAHHDFNDKTLEIHSLLIEICLEYCRNSRTRMIQPQKSDRQIKKSVDLEQKLTRIEQIVAEMLL